MTNQKKHQQKTQYGWDVECDCLGRMRSANPYFLSGEKPGEVLEKSGLFNKKQQNNSSNASKAGSLKRSLRKVRENPFLSPQMKKETNIQHEYYSPPHAPFNQERRDNRLLEFKQEEFRGLSPRISFNFQTPLTHRNPMVKVGSCQNLQQSNHAVKQIVYPPILLNPYPQTAGVPPLSPRIKFRQQLHNAVPSPRSKAEETPLMKKEMATESRTAQQIPSPYHLNIPTFSNQDMNTLKSERSIRSRRSEQISINYDFLPNEQMSPADTCKNKVKKETVKSKVEKKNYNVSEFQSFRSKIETKKSKVGEVGRSKIAGKKGKEAKGSLKRMNDVQQICSMIDSEEVSEESDQESVVLGRLRQYNQYGSNVEPSITETMPSSQSKLGYQSTTAGKSLLRAFEQSHFR